MNLLMRSNIRTTAQELQPTEDHQVKEAYLLKAATPLEDLIAEDTFLDHAILESRYSETDERLDENVSINYSSGAQADRHIDVKEDEGLIIIPCGEVPDNWTQATDMLEFRSLNRDFIFPGEQIQILACLSAYKQDTEIITPFKVAAAMNKNGIGKNPDKQNGNIVQGIDPVSRESKSDVCKNQQGQIFMKGKIDSHEDISVGESLLRMEDHKRQTEKLLQRFENSHYFVRISGSNDPLWSKRGAQETCLESSVEYEEQGIINSSGTGLTAKKNTSVCVVTERGKTDTSTSGGLARGAIRCCSLSNGDIVVLLQVNIGVKFVKDPVLEILQFEKHEETKQPCRDQNLTDSNQDPYGELLKWLLPLDNSIPPPPRSLTPPLSSSSGIRTTSSRSASSGSASSQLFSFGHLRSYSMSSLPPNSSPTPAVATPNDKPVVEPEDWNQLLYGKFVETGQSANEKLLSFRGVPLQPERFSVRCGLEGIFTPGRRWRRKIELIQPVKIDSFFVDCNTEDLLCVHVKNVSPAEGPDIVVLIDAITLVLEEAASKGGQPLVLPVSCVGAGNNYSLPNISLRKGEEHSFILKPATTFSKHPKSRRDTSGLPSRLPTGNTASIWHNSLSFEGKESGPPSDQYAVLLSCRCNYTESKLFFKQPTSWRPRISKDLMISVASEMSEQAPESDRSQLPVQVLTLQASNKTSENLTLTVLAPASFTSPTVVALSNSPTSPFSAFPAAAEVAERVRSDRQGAIHHCLSSVSLDRREEFDDSPPSVSIGDRNASVVDVVPNGDRGCTHLWLQSRVPLGCVPCQSSATIKLEVLPLTDGIISLDSLQIEVKEKGITYVPEQSLKIHATSSISTGKVPDNWTAAPDMLAFRSFSRDFVFPGERIQILASLSAFKQDTEIVSPFKVEAAMHKNGIGEGPEKENRNVVQEVDPVSRDTISGVCDNQRGQAFMKGKIDSLEDICIGESLLRMEDHKMQTEELIQRFKNSYYFVRIAGSNEQLWSKRGAQEAVLESSVEYEEQGIKQIFRNCKKNTSVCVATERGEADSSTCGGLARGAVKCCSLSNGDIVVHLQVNIGVQFVRDPVLEILQFEKHQETQQTHRNENPTCSNQDSCGELLKWLLPLDNSVSPPHSMTPPSLSSSSSIRSTSSRSSSSQLFSFGGHLRSYSMSSIPPNTSPTPTVTISNEKTVAEPADWNHLLAEKFVLSSQSVNEKLMSFRGVTLQPERFSVQCGLEGVFTPGHKWRRKIKLIQPVKIDSFSVDCNAEDLLCVHVKNVSPPEGPDIVVLIDAITLVLEEAAPEGGQPLVSPVSCIEAGNNYSLPNIALRRGEEHSFILKPAITLSKHPKSQRDTSSLPSRLTNGNTSSILHYSSSFHGKESGPPTDQYAVLLSCRCNYTESTLFFKQPTSWRPRISKDLMISVASEMSVLALEYDVPQLPVQVLTLQASNKTSENLTLTVLAPASFTPTTVSLSNSPSSPFSTFPAAAEVAARVRCDRQGEEVEDSSPSVSIRERNDSVSDSDMVPNGDLGCTHLWLQSRIPLGCVPCQSSAAIKLEVLPLTDGIITLDSLQIEVKEKGITYVPEQSLKIHATSSISTGSKTSYFGQPSPI